MLQGIGRICSFICFFFQAEDGIRDLVRSRGLGDVYKRQGISDAAYSGMCELQVLDSEDAKYANLDPRQYHGSVSYTHLTLPTSDLV